jgi:hypothetical protein
MHLPTTARPAQPAPARPRLRAPLVAVAAVLVGVVLLGTAGCGSGHGGASSSSSAGDVQAKPATGPEFEAGGSAASPGADSDSSVGKSASAVSAADLLQQRRLILDTALSLAVGNVAQSAGRVRALATGSGGYVGDEDTGGSGRTAHSTLTLRVPAAKVGAVTDQVAGLGTVRSRNLTSQDVTQQSIDVASRLATQKASIARVRALLARATRISDIILIEGELSNRESNLESLEAQLTSLNDSVDLATLTVNLSVAGAPPKPAKADTGFLAGLGHGWSAFVAALVVALTVLGAVLPFAALVALIGVPALLLYRRRRTGGSQLPAPTPAPET